MSTRQAMRQFKVGRALRQLTLGSGKSAGRNSSGCITIFHCGGGSKRLQRRIDLKRSSSSIGIVERVEYDPNRSSWIAPVRWIEGVQLQRKCNTVEEFAPLKMVKPNPATIRGLFSYSFLPQNMDQRKEAYLSPGLMAASVGAGRMPPWSKSPFTTTSNSNGAGGKRKITCTKDVFFSAFSSPKAKGETASLSLGSSHGFPMIAVAGAKPTFFAPRIREKVRESDSLLDQRGKSTTSLIEIRKWTPHSIIWAHRIKRKAALSWLSFRGKDTVDQGSLPVKSIGEGLKYGACKADRAPVTYIIASHHLEAAKMVVNCDWSKPSNSK